VGLVCISGPRLVNRGSSAGDGCFGLNRSRDTYAQENYFNGLSAESNRDLFTGGHGG
jgi:hypothetical protein